MSTPTLGIADNGYFYAYWSEGRRSRRKSMGTKDRAVAEARFGQWLLLGGHRGGPREEDGGSSLTVADCWVVYREKHGEEVAAPEALDLVWDKLGEHFGDLLVPQVDQDAVDRYVKLRGQGKIGRKAKPQTCRKELSILFACLRFCAEKPQRMFPAKIIETVKLPPAGEPRDRWLRTEEIQRLIDAAARMRRGPHLSRGERFLWIALETAARREAIMDLTWDRVDFEINVIHFDVPGRRQTKKKRASVPISRTLRPILERAYRERKNDLVMGNKGAIWATIQLIAIEAGFGGEKPERGQKPKATGISPHVLRHTAATHMARRGVSLYDIAKILGNSYQVVERTYAKWCPDQPERTVDLISAGLLEAAE